MLTPFERWKRNICRARLASEHDESTEISSDRDAGFRAAVGVHYFFGTVGPRGIVKYPSTSVAGGRPLRGLKNIATRSPIVFDRSRGVLVNPVRKFTGDPHSAGDQATPESYGDEEGKKDVF